MAWKHYKWTQILPHLQISSLNRAYIFPPLPSLTLTKSLFPRFHARQKSKRWLKLTSFHLKCYDDHLNLWKEEEEEEYKFYISLSLMCCAALSKFQIDPCIPTVWEFFPPSLYVFQYLTQLNNTCKMYHFGDGDAWMGWKDRAGQHSIPFPLQAWWNAITIQCNQVGRDGGELKLIHKDRVSIHSKDWL